MFLLQVVNVQFMNKSSVTTVELQSSDSLHFVDYVPLHGKKILVKTEWLLTPCIASWIHINFYQAYSIVMKFCDSQKPAWLASSWFVYTVTFSYVTELWFGSSWRGYWLTLMQRSKAELLVTLLLEYFRTWMHYYRVTVLYHDCAFSIMWLPFTL